MKRVEMELELFELGFADVQDMKWRDLQKLYRETIKITDEPVEVTSISKPTQDSVEEDLERKLNKDEKKISKLQKIRAELLPQIHEFVKSIKGKIYISAEERIVMYSLYNAYYERNDSGNCGSCVARVVTALRKLIKNKNI